MKSTIQVQINKKTRQQHQIISKARFRASIRPSNCTPTIGARGGCTALLPYNHERGPGCAIVALQFHSPGADCHIVGLQSRFPGVVCNIVGLQARKPGEGSAIVPLQARFPVPDYPIVGLQHLFLASHCRIIQQLNHKNMKYVLITRHNESFFHNIMPLFFKFSAHIIKQCPVYGHSKRRATHNKKNIFLYHQIIYAIFRHK